MVHGWIIKGATPDTSSVLDHCGDSDPAPRSVGRSDIGALRLNTSRRRRVETSTRGPLKSDVVLTDKDPMSASPLRAIVIEDAPATLILIETTLMLAGFSASGHVTGPDGFAACIAELPDLIVLDIALPGADGWQVLDQLRSTPATADSPVLILSAHGYEGMHARAVASGANAFMSKPFDPRQLQATALALVEAPR